MRTDVKRCWAGHGMYSGRACAQCEEKAAVAKRAEIVAQAKPQTPGRTADRVDLGPWRSGTPPAWITGYQQEHREAIAARQAARAQNPHEIKGDLFWLSSDWLDRTARMVGVERKPGETDEALRARCLEGITGRSAFGPTVAYEVQGRDQNGRPVTERVTVAVEPGGFRALEDSRPEPAPSPENRYRVQDWRQQVRPCQCVVCRTKQLYDTSQAAGRRVDMLVIEDPAENPKPASPEASRKIMDYFRKRRGEL